MARESNLETMRLSQPGRVPSARYFQQSWADAELRQLWPHVWTIAGHTTRWQKAGDVCLHNVGPASSLVVKQPDGSFAAFRNSCRHRGARLCEVDHTAENITCPVHGWSWQLDGAVRSIPGRSGLIDPPENLELATLPCGERFGFVWIAGSHEAPALDDYLAPVVSALEAAPLQSWLPRSWTTIQLDANWKVSADMHNEAYHLDKLHPELAQILDPDSVRLTPLGRHHRIDFTLYPPGAAAVEVSQIAVFPNAQFTIHADRAMVLWHRPHRNSPKQCLFDEMTVVAPELVSGPVDHRVVTPANTQLGAMATADLRSVRRLADGVVDADSDLLLHRLEGAIWHMHRGIDELVFKAADVSLGDTEANAS